MQQKIYNFMSLRFIFAAISVIFVLVSLGALAARGLNLGLDFTGGSLIELHYQQAPDLQEVRSALNDAGFSNPVVVNFGSETEVMVRLKAEDTAQAQVEDLGSNIIQALRGTSDAEIDLMRAETIGSQVGDELVNDGGLGMLTALAMVFLYIAVRFQSKFSVAAVAALIHDVIVTLGVFALFQLEFDLTVLAAVLAVIGYSINDTIVVFDRVRENLRIMRETPLVEVINVSLSQTLGRTLMTTGTTLLVLLALFFVGGALIHNFALALLVGIGVGTYSSIYVASAILMWLKLTREDLMPPVREGSELDELP